MNSVRKYTHTNLYIEMANPNLYLSSSVLKYEQIGRHIGKLN